MATYKTYRYTTYQSGIDIFVKVFRRYGKKSLFKFRIFGTRIDDTAKREIESAIEKISVYMDFH